MEIYHQLNLPQFRETTNINSFKAVAVGSPAESVFKSIIQNHKRIKTFSVFSYDLNIDSGDNLQAVGMQQFRRRDLQNGSLYRLSNQIQTEDGKDFGIAIASSVKLIGGDEFHIPMLDFASRSKMGADLNVEKITDILKPYPGFILETGGSLHFWGVSLLSIKSWQKFLDNCLNNFKDNEIDHSFIDYSKKRGFSGLRIFSYGKTKQIEPWVVAKVGIA